MKTWKITLLALLAALLPSLTEAQTTESYTFTTNRAVPDGDLSGLSDLRTITSSIQNISSLKVRLKVTGEFNGDVYAYLRHTSGFAVLLNRPGKTTSMPYGYADSGFDVTFQAGAVNGDIHNYELIATPANGSPLTGIWEPDGRNMDPLSVTDLSTRTTSLTNFNGLNGSGDWTLYLTDTESGGTNQLTEWGLDISGTATPTISWTNSLNFAYGTPLSATQLSTTVTYGSTNVPGTFSYNPPLGTVLNAGTQTVSITFTPTDLNAFLTLTNNLTVNILPAPLTITANSTNKDYGTSLPTFTASYSGFVNGDTAASLSSAVSLSTSASTSSPVGSYAITASGASSSNYSITFAGGTLTVAPVSLVITAQNQTKVYGAPVPALTASYSGFVNGDDATSLTAAPSLATSATISSGVGSYNITASGAAATNYTISYANGSLSVTPATITITADSKSIAFGTALPALTATYSGFVLGQGTTDLGTLASISTTATASSGAGSYPITASGAVSANYSFNYIAGTLTIGQSASIASVASSANPGLPGSNVTFTVSVHAVTGSGTPTGTVKYRVDGNMVCTNTLSGGSSTFTTASLGLGSHTVLVEYAGDSNFTGTTNSLAQNEMIDTPPVASNVTISRNPLAGVKVHLSTLQASASDMDGDTLTLNVSAASANGGVVSVSGGWVFYTPAAGFTNADSFTYTVNDGRGGSATGTVFVTIQNDSAPSQNLTITSLGNGSYLISGSGIPGYTYRLQSSDSSTPFNWQALTNGSVTADSNGKFSYTDNTAASMRFYRSVYP